MHKTVFLLGGNQGNRKDLILRAIQLLKSQIGDCKIASSLYETEAWGFKTELAFLNQVLVFETEKSPREILKIAQKIESDLGRIRSSDGYSSRTMDIDILFYDNLIVSDSDLQIPHPRLHLRRFTLEPLVEIMPDYIHPLIAKSMQELLIDCNDKLNIIKLEK